MSTENNNFTVFVKTGVLYKCFIAIDKITDYQPNITSDIFAVNELEALEFMMNENIYPIKFPPHTLSEIPKYIQKRIEQADRKRAHIQSILKTGNINEIQKIKLIFAEIKIDSNDIKSIAENQIKEKYLCISLQDTKFSIAIHEKHIKEFYREIDGNIGQVTVKNLVFMG